MEARQRCGGAQFDRWFKEAVAAKVAQEPNQMALATANADGVPSVRMVLLKGYDARGFMFYTNYDSRKAAELANGRAALHVLGTPAALGASLGASLWALRPSRCVW